MQIQLANWKKIAKEIRFLIVLFALSLPVLAIEETKTSTKTIPANQKNVSIHFQDIPVRSILQIMAEKQNFNLVISDSVQGNITINLDEVPWQKALDTILQIRGLDKRLTSGILLIAPKAELELQEQQALEKLLAAQELTPLVSQIIPINYANAEELMTMLSGGNKNIDINENSGVSFLSKRGSISVDTRTNALIIREIPQNIEVIEALIAKLDIPVEQVEIMARIVSIDQGNLDELGIRWGLRKTGENYAIGGSIESNQTHSDLQPNNIDDYLNVNLAAISPRSSSIALQVASLGRDFLLDLELSALQAESRAEIISTPRLLTTNKRAAYIEQGTELPYLESSSSGAAAVSFKKAVLSLAVKPQITHDKKLVLDLDLTQDKPSATVQAGTGEAVSINTQRISTQVLVENGETVVLGGIFQHETLESVDKVPFFGDIPFVGWIFRKNYQSSVKRELLIFVTPRIIVQ